MFPLGIELRVRMSIRTVGRVTVTGNIANRQDKWTLT